MRRNVIISLSTIRLILYATFAYEGSDTKHTLSYSSVDSGEIRWGESTKYTNAWNHAVSTWNALGNVNIAPDDAST